ncbi:MAG: DUF4270 family protein [bacterium]
MKTKQLLFSILLATTATLTACSDKETPLGTDLVDPNTLYKGEVDTLYADNAWTEHEDSMLTSGYSYGIIGNYFDNTFGHVSSILYTQIALPSNSSSISFDEKMIIDSVVLQLAKSQLFPDTGQSSVYNFHFEVAQLASALSTDSQYYSYSEIDVDPTATFFNAPVPVAYTDSLVSLRLDTSINSILRNTSSDNFINTVKGLRISITDAGATGMMTIDFSSVKTCLKTYYHYVYNGDTTHNTFTFLMGAGTNHFTQFKHNYNGTLFAGNSPVNGTQRLYLEPLGGLQVRMSFDRDIKAFHEAHPYAVVQRAELILPVSPEVSDNPPDQILTLYKETDGSDTYVYDLIDSYTLKGYDGTYDAGQTRYRMRITQHVQKLIHQGADSGFLFILNSRRHAAQRVSLYGTSMANRPHIIITYTE